MVKVSGSRYVPAEKYTIKLEGAKEIGFRTVSVAGARDPIFINQLDDIIAGVRERVADNFRSLNATYHLIFHVYGKDGVMGELEPEKEMNPVEVGISIRYKDPVTVRKRCWLAF